MMNPMSLAADTDYELFKSTAIIYSRQQGLCDYKLMQLWAPVTSNLLGSTYTTTSNFMHRRQAPHISSCNHSIQIQ